MENENYFISKQRFNDIISRAQNHLLQEIIKNHHYCQHCSHCSKDNICFFAYPCITKDFYYFKERKE